MKRYLLIYSAWISLLLITGVACRSARVSYSGTWAANPIDSLVSGSFEKMTFKTVINWGEREISGLMLVKKMEDGNLRIAFYNELGMTYLEGTLDRSSKHSKLIVKNIAPAIDYKPFIKNFERCLQMAFPLKYGLSAIPDKVELRNGFNLELKSNY